VLPQSADPVLDSHWRAVRSTWSQERKTPDKLLFAHTWCASWFYTNLQLVQFLPVSSVLSISSWWADQ